MDLVSQVRAQHEQKRREASVRRVTRPIFWTTVMILMLIAVAIGYERYALGRTVEDANARLRLGGMFELLAAETDLVAHTSGAGFFGPVRALAGKVGFGGVLNDQPARAALALVRARLLVDHDGDPVGLTGAGSQGRVDEDAPEASVLAAAVALVSSDSDTVTANLERAETTSADATATQWFGRHLAWLHGVAALQSPQPVEAERASAVERMHTADPDAAAWPGYQVVQARLIGRLHDEERARELLVGATTQGGAPPLVHAVQAWRRALRYEDATAITELADEALSDPRPVDVRSRVFAAMAKALVQSRVDAERDTATKELIEAWAALPPWEVDTHLAVLETAAEVGAWANVEAWLASFDAVPAAEAHILRAWQRFDAGEPQAVLAALAEQPQDHARVAYLQGLALAEELRFEEAKPWLERGADLLPGRPDLLVALARVAVRTDDASAKAQAKSDLIGLGQAHPYARRVWTGIGEAHLRAAAEPDDAAMSAARTAFERATTDETAPAEAWLRLAELPPAAAAEAQPEGASVDADQSALSALRRAAQIKPDAVRYAAAYGHKLAELGYTTGALAVCLPLADSPSVDAAFLLELVRLVYVEALQNGGDVPKASGAWLERAAALGASVPDLVRARTRLDVASDARASWNRARSQMAIVLTETPDDFASRKLLIEAILRSNDGATALATAEAGVSAASGVDEAELYLLMAQAEAVRGEKRLAARNSWRGWKKLLRADATPAQLLPAAQRAIDHWYALEQPSTARSIARDLGEALPEHPAAWAIRGHVQLETGFPQQACESAEKSLDLDGEYAPGLGLQAACLASRGQKDEARAVYRKAAELALSDAERAGYVKAGKSL